MARYPEKTSVVRYGKILEHLYTLRREVYTRIGWSPHGERVIQNLRFPRLAPTRLASVCGRVECLTRLFLPKSVRECLTCGLRLPFDPSNPRVETRALKGHSIHRRRRSYRSTCKSERLPPTVFSFEEVAPGIRRFIYSNDTSCWLYDRLVWHAALIARVLLSDIYNIVSRHLCIKFCAARLDEWSTGSELNGSWDWLLKQVKIL